MKQVSALVTEIVLKSDLKPWIEARCAAAGAEVTWHNVTQSTASYKEVFKSSTNVITWQCRMPHSWTTNWGNNVLHIENSLLCQKAGAFVDSRGFFSQSNLRVSGHWNASYDVDLGDFARRHFGWDAFSGGNPDGPVLVTLQCRKDCNINFEYPASPRGDKVVFTINKVLEHLPRSREVLIRPHPREREQFADLPPPEGCEWSLSGDFQTLLPQCSGMVTVNSTCASEACLLGLPVATLGTGAFTGSGATFECHECLSRLAHFFDHQNNLEAQQRYCSAILGAHFLPYRHEGEVRCPEFDLWLARLR
jgi:hypothetical protein